MQVKKMSNYVNLLIKYVKSFFWRVAKCLSYIEDARCLKVQYKILHFVYKELIWVITDFSVVVECDYEMDPAFLVVSK